MALTRDDLHQVQDFVLAHLNEWLPQPVFQLSDRIVRVEEELRHQRELMQQSFAHVEKRFNLLTWMIGVGFVVIATLTTVFATVR